MLNQTWATEVTIVKPYIAALRRSKAMLTSEDGRVIGVAGRKSAAVVLESWMVDSVVVEGVFVVIDSASELLSCGGQVFSSRVLEPIEVD